MKAKFEKTNAALVHAFTLYLAGASPNSLRAKNNLHALCRKYLPDRHQIVIVDIFKDPMRAITDGIYATPTLVRHQPGLVCVIIGDLSNTAAVIAALGLG